LLVSFFTAVIFENFHLHARGVALAESRGKLNFTVHGVVVFNEATYKSNDNYARRVGLSELGSRRR